MPKAYREIPVLSPIQVDRFWSRVAVPDLSGCCNWLGNIDRYGYGLFSIYGYDYRPHRVSVHLLDGSVDPTKTVDHTCRNRKCVARSHLEVVTFVENVLRGEGPTAVNARKTHCVNGHELSGSNLGIQHGRYRMCRACKNASERRRYHSNAAKKRT